VIDGDRPTAGPKASVPPLERTGEPIRRHAATAASRRRLRRRLTLRLEQIAVLAVLIGAWELAVSQGWIDELVSRTPLQVWDFTWQMSSSGLLWSALWSTIEATLIGFALASVVGTVVGMGLGLLPRTEAVLNPFFDAFNSMPRIAFGPVFILYFGITTTAKVALAFTVVVFIMIYNARAGIKSADPEIMRLSKALGASRLQLFQKVLLPVSVPSIFAGLRLSMIYSLLGVVTSEIIASRQGMGQLINEYSQTFKLEGVYGLLIVLAIVGMLLNAILLGAENWFLRWRPKLER
jgi:NitT/TauT family transport system permease protein